MAKQHGVCALCRKEADLELSHIVPKMVVRELKKTSVGQLRSTENPNGTVQDTEKHYMLCGECEDLFSEYETIFSKFMLHPYLRRIPGARPLVLMLKALRLMEAL